MAIEPSSREMSTLAFPGTLLHPAGITSSQLKESVRRGYYGSRRLCLATSPGVTNCPVSVQPGSRALKRHRYDLLLSVTHATRKPPSIVDRIRHRSLHRSHNLVAGCEGAHKGRHPGHRDQSIRGRVEEEGEHRRVRRSVLQVGRTRLAVGCDVRSHPFHSNRPQVGVDDGPVSARDSRGGSSHEAAGEVHGGRSSRRNGRAGVTAADSCVCLDARPGSRTCQMVTQGRILPHTSGVQCTVAPLNSRPSSFSTALLRSAEVSNSTKLRRLASGGATSGRIRTRNNLCHLGRGQSRNKQHQAGQSCERNL